MSQIDYQSILDTYRDLHARANQANEQRYNEMLDVIRTTNEQVGQQFDESLGLLENLGAADRQRIEQQAQQAQAQTEQDLISRGLAGTTVRETARRGIAADTERAQQEVTERVGRQQAGMMQAAAGAEERGGQFLAQMMERRTDQGPDLGMMANLLQQAGQAEGATTDGTVQTGLSPRARAGQAIGGAAGSPGGPQFGTRAPAQSTQDARGARVIRGAAHQAAGRQTGATGPAGASGTARGGPGAGQRGTGFDDLFAGQDVFRGGDVVGEYAGAQQIDLADDLNLVDQRGELDTERLPEGFRESGPADAAGAADGDPHESPAACTRAGGAWFNGKCWFI